MNHHSIVEVIPSTFDAVVRRSVVPVVLAIFQNEGNVRLAMLSTLEHAALLPHGPITFAWADLNTQPELAGELGIAATPALLLIKNGEVTYQFIGQWARRELIYMVTRIGACGVSPSIGKDIPNIAEFPGDGPRFGQPNAM